MPDKISIYIIDDHQMLVDGLVALLKDEALFTVVGTNTNPEKAIEEIKELQPLIILTDVNMPVLKGPETIRQLKPFVPGSKFVAMSMSGDRHTVQEMVAAGAAGFILKNAGKEELMMALQKIAAGKHHYSDEIAQALASANNDGDSSSPVLTLREQEIVKLMAREFTNAMIADTLFISERTVETHRKNIFRKTQTGSVLGLINWARKMKYIDN